MNNHSLPLVNSFLAASALKPVAAIVTSTNLSVARFSIKALFSDTTEVEIEHHGALYRLRLTSLKSLTTRFSGLPVAQAGNSRRIVTIGGTLVGNRYVKLDQMNVTPIGTLTPLHMSIGVGAFWILLSDTIAGGLILLSITRLLLWSQLHTVRSITVMTSVGALFAGT